jgi:hypothetical protein
MDFITVFSFIIFLVLVPFEATGIHWLGARAGELIQAKVKNERLRAALLRLEDAVVTAVKDVEQTLVVEYRELASDGKLSREDRRRLKETAVRKVKTFLGSAGLKELGNVLDVWKLSVENLIGAKVEATILDMKTATPPAAATPTDEPPAKEVAS